ncbi:hypothetical protein SERLA73DRAFT_119706 [Serpula lacrymans var. lacrymans S7.3]|uniref:DUF6589 domain-containing protein n=2 Tax=Serpula lacrymans var. lacrymans TaxID=341189 RepID=F8PLH4_SERL3|nr:uncharacterized protein SERLADRAFT_366051 [Serpula lacrymans var. lacrymans S7.9]EGO02456.1 hypothetical protein SERLA73DRAFT_119706 [Serpula lacrymans var. lacrymans S7.3]EGO28184.1 hypothetical protein SERLADRAFT_366051 [Serpula lacrymans var. lacrymans S7.9]
MYSPETPYLEIKPARPALTSFAVQIVDKQLRKEQQKVLQPETGLATHQPLLWHYILSLSSPRICIRNGICAHIISSIDFSHTENTRILPAKYSILYFACGAPKTLFTHGSRIAHTMAYSTTYSLLHRLSDHKATYLFNLGNDEIQWPIIQMDNVQGYTHQRNSRIGREDIMITGTAGTVIEAHNFNMIDQAHHRTIMSLHWLQVLVFYVPELAHYKTEVSQLICTKALKKRLSLKATVAHPLATNTFNETRTTELKEALLDFLAQINQTPDFYKQRLVLVGGDGLNLKRYLQFHSNTFERLDIIEPILELWHTEWTNLSRLFETHWGEGISNDPSTLGHSASQIGRKAPINLKKVDYYPCFHLANLVLETWLLDCWSLSSLEEMAVKLHRQYSSMWAYHNAMTKPHPADPHLVPTGLQWDPGSVPNTVHTRIVEMRVSVKVKKSKKKTEKEVETGAPFEGDQCLAQSILLMRDSLIARKMAYAVSDGDIGRVYECLKLMVFTFSGSLHTKYTTYLLEMICSLKYESSDALRNAIMQNWLVNLEGTAGSFYAGDLLQEHLNNSLQESRDHNDVPWDSHFMRNIVSHNVLEFSRIKKDMLAELSLARRSNKHAEPHNQPKVKRLLQTYQEHKIHLFRSGRHYSGRDKDVDDFTRGLNKLLQGTLSRWVNSTMTTRGLSSPSEMEDLIEEDDKDGVEEMYDTGPRRNGTSYIENGELQIEYDELESGEQEALCQMAQEEAISESDETEGEGTDQGL